MIQIFRLSVTQKFDKVPKDTRQELLLSLSFCRCLWCLVPWAGYQKECIYHCNALRAATWEDNSVGAVLGATCGKN